MASAHTDCGLLNPSVYIDDVANELECKHAYPELVKLAKKPGMPGY